MTDDHLEQERLSHLLRALAAQDADALPPSQVQLTVTRLWNERMAMGDSLPTAPPRSQARSPLWTAACVSSGVAGLAAMLLLVSWVGGRTTEHTAPAVPTPRLAIAEVPLKPVPSGFTAVEPRRPPVATQRSDVSRNDVASARDVVAPATAEVEPFVRLLPMTEQELGTVRLARVRLRGQAARTLGLEARMPLPGADGFVEADVLLGEDGLARAIRFVR